MRKALTVLLCLAVLVSQILCVPARAADMARPVNSTDLSGYAAAKENDRLVLYYRQDMAQIAVMDKRTGRVWQSSLPDDQIPSGNINDEILREFDSLVILTYTMLNKLSSIKTTAPLESFEYELEAAATAEGVSYGIRIAELNLKFNVIFSLNEYGLKVTLPSAGIIEGEGIGKQIETKVKAVSGFIEKTKGLISEIKADKHLPQGLKGDLAGAERDLGSLRDNLAKIKTAVGIEQQSQDLLETLNEIENRLVGSSSRPGFFSRIAVDEKLDVKLKSAYRNKQLDFEDAIMPIKITVSSLKAISVGSLVEMEILPYFGACSDSARGYMVYPNGSGAVTEYKEKHGQYTSQFKVSVFSDQTPDIDWEESMDRAGLKRTPIPYFGAVQDNSGFIAYVAGGQSESTITFSPSGYIFNVNRINAGFVYRRTIAIPSAGGVWQAGAQPAAYEERRGEYDASLIYMFLDRDEASYSGMAKALRQYMSDNGTLVPNDILKKGKIPLALDIFGGYTRKVLLFDNYMTGTTFTQASRMIREICGDQKIPLLVNYVGYAKGGYLKYPSPTETAPALGSLDDLKRLSAQVAGTGGRLFLSDNHVLTLFDRGGYRQGELALGTNLRVIVSADKTKYILSPGKVLERVRSKYVPFAKKAGVFGYTEDFLGSFIYYDYSNKNFTTRSQTVDIWKETLKAVREGAGGVAVNGGNEYVFPYADWILNVPTETSGYIYTDYGIPFYQMLIHGYIPYTSDPINQYYDKSYQFLKSIEYGNLPYYRLTFNDVDTNEAGIYVSRYSAFKDDIADSYNAFSRDLAGIVDKQILSHERQGDTVAITYSDGTEVYINYGQNTAQIKGKSIEPMSYAITRPVGGDLIEKAQTKPVQERGEDGISVHSPLDNRLLYVLLVSLGVFNGAFIFLFKRRRFDEA